MMTQALTRVNMDHLLEGTGCAARLDHAGKRGEARRSIKKTLLSPIRYTEGANVAPAASVMEKTFESAAARAPRWPNM